MKLVEQFIHCYPVSKTLQFRLIPVLDTQVNLDKFNIVSVDEEKAEKYTEVKPIFDKCHKIFISRCLSKYSMEWQPLFDALNQAQKSKDTATYDALKAQYQKAISKYLKADDEYFDLKPKAIIDSVSKPKGEPAFCEFSEEEQNALKTFARFSTYFEGYRVVRENIYSFGISSSVAYRIVEENFPRFAANVKLYESLPDDFKQNLEEQLATFTGGKSVLSLFTIEGFNHVLTQEGIDSYNTVLGGVTADETTKVQGLNELCNLAYQQGHIGKVKFLPLYKQILSDRSTFSFLPQQFETDRELLAAVREYAKMLFDTLALNTDELLASIEQAETQKIFVDKKQVAFLSQIAYAGNWSAISAALTEQKVKESAIYSLDVLNRATGIDLMAVVMTAFGESQSKMQDAYAAFDAAFAENRIHNYDTIKAFLDAVQDCEKVLKILVAPEILERDAAFYPVFDDVYAVLRENIPLYNKVRNYATKKPYSTRKFKLNFECPTLADGWDQNKEYSNNTVLFFKDGQYYVGIFNARAKVKLQESDAPSEGAYKKMVYKLLPDPSKMLPKVFFSKKGLETFGENTYILDGYSHGLHKKGENFDLRFCHELIDYFKDGIARHPDWSKFGFVFSDTNTYQDTSDFYREITQQAYKISFSYVDAAQVESMVANGNLFLFRLYNKDFSSYAKGRKNLFTLYWEEVFSDENLLHPLYKLNGQAELFYRPASVDNPFVHQQGSILISKNDVDNKPVDENVFAAATADANNGLGLEQLQSKYPDLVFKIARYDIVKDKRYVSPSFSFHVPITMNYGVDNKYSKFNTAVLDALQGADDYAVIGIDRGERNLIYVSVVDKNGDILCQKSFNTIGTVDYHSKLDTLEKYRDKARKNWKRIDAIKDLKEGYLSSVVKEICDMMVQYNAVLIMEDLNFGFKRGRFHIEKQVYQKFEKMLIDKLNFFADKSKQADEPGGIRKAYQLTNKFESFQKLGKQSGFLFYVPAGYTSKIDPLTGFVNLFTSKQLNYKSADAARDFIRRFDSISYTAEFGFRFDFRYSNFDLFKSDYTDAWSVYSAGDNRIVHTKKDGYDTTVALNVTDELAALLQQYGMDFTGGNNLIAQLVAVQDAAFFKKFVWLFKSLVQLRYEDKDNDFILSPVMCDGRFFDSRIARENEPQDGDANGAYHIALQGLRMIARIENGKIKADEKNMQAYNWFKFAQTKPYLNN